jgi:hypothetical protein
VARSDPFPIEAVRDLLGICRALFAARKRDHAPKDELEELAVIGAKLRQALELAKKTEPNTVGHRAAWDHADVATERLTRVIGISMAAAPLVEAAVFRVRRIHPKPREAEQRKSAERTRR